jgi:hypothetical protein
LILEKITRNFKEKHREFFPFLINIKFHSDENGAVDDIDVNIVIESFLKENNK